MEKISSFKYRNIELKSGHWKKQYDETIEFYLSISNDEMLHIFRKKAGIKSSVNGLAGWYGSNASVFGQIIGALAKLYRATNDFRIKEKVLILVTEWEKCADKEPEILTNGTYVYEKLLGGFLDLYEFMDYKSIEPYISRLTDSAIKLFIKSIKRDGLQDKALSEANMIEWYTLPENLYRAYTLTGDKKYLEFAKEWDYDYFWNKLNSMDFKIGPRHAYSHVNSLSSAARAYEVSGNEKYLSAIKNAYDEITRNHTFATGGYGPAECIFTDREGYLGDSLKSTWDSTLGDPMYTNFAGYQATRSDSWGSCEVSCCAWAVFKICNYLIRFTGQAKYGDWAEKMLYNGLGGQLPVTPDGKVMYYASYFLDGAIKSVEDRRLMPEGYGFEWQCCTGTYPQDIAEYVNMLYYFDSNGIYISQYLPSTMSWVKDGVKIGIENYSDFPESSQLKFRVWAEQKVSFDLHFRVPSWAKGSNCVKVNGKEIAVNLEPDSWGCISGEWNDGDIICIDFPFELYFKSVDNKNKEIMALNYGPLVLTSDEMTDFIGDPDKADEWIHRSAGDTLAFETDAGHVAGYDFLTRKFTPYYKVPAMQWYYMYNRVRK